MGLSLRGDGLTSALITEKRPHRRCHASAPHWGVATGSHSPGPQAVIAPSWRVGMTVGELMGAVNSHMGVRVLCRKRRCWGQNPTSGYQQFNDSQIPKLPK